MNCTEGQETDTSSRSLQHQGVFLVPACACVDVVQNDSVQPAFRVKPEILRIFGSAILENSGIIGIIACSGREYTKPCRIARATHLRQVPVGILPGGWERRHNQLLLRGLWDGGGAEERAAPPGLAPEQAPH